MDSNEQSTNIIKVATGLERVSKQIAVTNRLLQAIDPILHPNDKMGNHCVIDLGKFNLIKVLKLFYFTDVFITYTNVVLGEEGVLE